MNGRLFTMQEYLKYQQFKSKMVRKVYFKFFDIWKSRMDDPNTAVGQRLMNRLYDQLLELES